MFSAVVQFSHYWCRAENNSCFAVFAFVLAPVRQFGRDEAYCTSFGLFTVVDSGSPPESTGTSGGYRVDITFFILGRFAGAEEACFFVLLKGTLTHWLLCYIVVSKDALPEVSGNILTHKCALIVCNVRTIKYNFLVLKRQTRCT